MSEDRVYSVVLAGVGGQGILLASDILSTAAMHAGYDVKTNEVHGMAQRGGSVIGQVRYAREVFSPLVPEGAADVFASMEKIEGIRFAHFLAPGGLAIVSSQEIVPVTVSSGAGTYPLDAEERIHRIFPRLVYMDAAAMAVEAGDMRAANTVILGAISNGLELPLEAWYKAIEECVKPRFRELNLKAFEAGRGAA
jgi:indolepyruvate ferredoxin oxidoreductase beta subunit